MSLFLIYSIFFIFVFPVKAKIPNFDMMLNPTIEVYAKDIAHCDIENLDFSHGLNSIKGICQSVVESPLCANIHEDYRMDCENIYFDPTFTILAIHYPKTITVSERPEEYELGHGYNSRFFEGFSVFWECLKGGGQFTADVFSSLLTMVQTATVSLISSLKNTYNEKEISAYLSGMNHYAMAEFEQPKTNENNAVPKQSLDLWNIAVETIQNKYKNFACLSAQGRNKLFCQMALEITANKATSGLTGKIMAVDTAWKTLKNPHTIQAKNPFSQDSAINKAGIR